MRSLDAQCVFAWTVLPLVSLLCAVALLMALSSLVGGAAKLFGICACGGASVAIFKRSMREGLTARLFGWVFATVLGLLAIVMTGVLG